MSDQDPEVNNQGEDFNDNEYAYDIPPVSGMYENWFIDYASYVILERAVPAIEDGLKPVQRRILHAMKTMDDGRFNKVANIIGATMQYHPHGDASIGDAIVGLGQKELLIETQGNWGDIRTGDAAAAPRYIEARLSKFAHEVVFNPDLTEWQLSYDGRKKEPVTLPVKFPLVLAQGVEGIAVGLSTKVLSHNFIEVTDAAINYLKGKTFELYPDFQTGGLIDVSQYNDGARSGKIKVRARIEEKDKKTLIIREIPWGTTTSSLMDSIVKANDAGKIKIKKVIDNTAKDVEIEVQLAPNTSPDVTIDALYAFTDCEFSIGVNACLIDEDKPKFLSVSDILKKCTDQTVYLLKKELEIKKADLKEKLLFSSLEKIFIDEEMYINFKEYTDKESLLNYLDECFESFKPQFYREIGYDDYEKLTQIPMIRITRFDKKKADEKMQELQKELDNTEYSLNNIIDFSISFFNNLKEKYGKGRERKTDIQTFDRVEVSRVAATNTKLYMNTRDGFIGYGLKKDTFVCECSDIDDIIVVKKDGKFKVVRIGEKVYVGKDIIYAGVFDKNDIRMVYNMVYVDGASGKSFVKRFQVGGITKDREYDLTKGNKNSKILYFTANPNGEAEIFTVTLTPGCSAKKKIFDYDFSEIAIKGKGAQGNILTRYPIKKISFKKAGGSTLGGLDIWYENETGRLNTETRGTYLGEFKDDDQILVIYKTGHYELTNYELTNRYDNNKLWLIEKFDPQKIVSAIYYDGEQKTYYLKRFRIETETRDKAFSFITENKNSSLLFVTTKPNPLVKVNFKGNKSQKAHSKELQLNHEIDIKGWKAKGNKIAEEKIKDIDLLSYDENKTTENESSQNETKEQNGETSSESWDVGSSIDLDVNPGTKNDQNGDNGNGQMGLF